MSDWSCLTLFPAVLDQEESRLLDVFRAVLMGQFGRVIIFLWRRC